MKNSVRKMKNLAKRRNQQSKTKCNKEIPLKLTSGTWKALKNLEKLEKSLENVKKRNFSSVAFGNAQQENIFFFFSNPDGVKAIRRGEEKQIFHLNSLVWRQTWRMRTAPKSFFDHLTSKIFRSFIFVNNDNGRSFFVPTSSSSSTLFWDWNEGKRREGK